MGSLGKIHLKIFSERHLLPSLIKSKKRKEIINYKMNKSETMNIIKKKKVRNNLTITKINNNDKEKYFKNILKYNDSELSSLSYKDAL